MNEGTGNRIVVQGWMGIIFVILCIWGAMSVGFILHWVLQKQTYHVETYNQYDSFASVETKTKKK